MKIVILNMGYSGYWVACWRELTGRAGISVRIFSPHTKYPYASNFLDGMPITLLDANEMSDARLVCDRVAAEKPDVVIIGGWASKAFKSVAYDRRFSSVKKIVMIDSAWTGSLRQILQRIRLHSFVKRMDAIIVAGERGRQYARWLGFKSERIFPSIYGYDAAAFEPCMANRGNPWPRRFCFVGRYAKVKGLDSLLAAYRRYRTTIGGQAWPLDCYGSGVMKDILQQEEGVIDHGFLQPSDLPRALESEGVFVFPSLHEPWGVALAEAAGAGLPIVCSDQVASGLDLVKIEYNGLVFPAGNVDRLANALIRMHEIYNQLPLMGERSRVLAEAYSPSIWCNRWLEALKCI